MTRAEITRVVPVSCDRDCGGCPLCAHVSQGRVVRITDNPLKPLYVRGCIKGYRMAAPLYPLRMVTPHSKFRINSQDSNLPWAGKLARQVLVMNVLYARGRGIQSGDGVRVLSRQGEMEIEAFLTDDIIPGCVSLIQGAWSVRDSQGVEKGGAANILTSTHPTLPSQGPRTHSVFVEVGTRAETKRRGLKAPA